MSEKILITYGDSKITMEWDGAQASAPILIDGESTPYQTADARHSTGAAVRLAAEYAWGRVYDTWEAARAAGHDDDSQIVVWDDLAYEAIDAPPADEDE